MSNWRIVVEGHVGKLKLSVDLQGDDKRALVLTGPNAAGKTTLLRILCGAVRPQRAEIEFAGRLLFSSSRQIDLPMEERRIGYVPQGCGLFPHLTVLDNVAFALRSANQAQRRQRAFQMLSRFDCEQLAGRLPLRLSGGEQQRVALARALVAEPDVLLLDEPLAALDSASRRQMRATLAACLNELARPAIVVTHDLRDAAALKARVCVMEQGRITQQGTLDELRASPASDFVAEFAAVERAG